jgi:hypothetical protein
MFRERQAANERQMKEGGSERSVKYGVMPTTEASDVRAQGDRR